MRSFIDIIGSHNSSHQVSLGLFDDILLIVNVNEVFFVNAEDNIYHFRAVSPRTTGTPLINHSKMLLNINIYNSQLSIAYQSKVDLIIRTTSGLRRVVMILHSTISAELRHIHSQCFQKAPHQTGSFQYY